METEHEQKSGSASEAQAARKPYRAPTLIPWGSLRDMTRAAGRDGASDGGTKHNKRGTH